MTEDWTVHTLKALVETQLCERDRRWEAERRAIAQALEKAERQNEARLAMLNEFRQQSLDEHERFISRVEFDALKERQGETAELARTLNRMLVPLIWLGSVLVVSIIGVFISHVTTGAP